MAYGAPRKTAANVNWTHQNGCACRDFEFARAEYELAGPVHGVRSWLY